MKKIDPQKVYEEFKKRKTANAQIYDENVHCPLLLEIMTAKSLGTVSAFCVEALIGENTFWDWTNNYEVFGDLYQFCKMYSRELWEQEGRELKDITLPIGTISHGFDYWKLIGWSRFGISKNSRIRLHLNPKDNPSEHYSQLLKQAAQGDFTASEIKQLMEAVNVGLSTHQVFELQKEIDQLKSDLGTMQANTDAHNTSTTKGFAQKD